MELAEGERLVKNPGNKRCRVCGGLILDETLVYYGCNIRHLKCHRKPPKRPNVGLVKTPQADRRGRTRTNMAKLVED